jgi:hypothetical protein
LPFTSGTSFCEGMEIPLVADSFGLSIISALLCTVGAARSTNKLTHVGC